jgi:hypothetical protein
MVEVEDGLVDVVELHAVEPDLSSAATWAFVVRGLYQRAQMCAC